MSRTPLKSHPGWATGVCPGASTPRRTSHAQVDPNHEFSKVKFHRRGHRHGDPGQEPAPIRPSASSPRCPCGTTRNRAHSTSAETSTERPLEPADPRMCRSCSGESLPTTSTRALAASSHRGRDDHEVRGAHPALPAARRGRLLRPRPSRLMRTVHRSSGPSKHVRHSRWFVIGAARRWLASPWDAWAVT